MSISNSKMDSPGFMIYYMFKTIQCCIGVVNLLGKAIPWSSVPLTWRSAISSWKAFAMFQPRTHHLSSLFIVSYESQVFQNVHGWGILGWSCRVPSVNRAPQRFARSHDQNIFRVCPNAWMMPWGCVSTMLNLHLWLNLFANRRVDESPRRQDLGPSKGLQPMLLLRIQKSQPKCTWPSPLPATGQIHFT